MKDWLIAIAKIGGLLLVAYFLFLFPNGYDRPSTGQVNLFPTDAESKNYRLDAQIDVHGSRLGILRGYDIEYTINTVTWPNEGTSHFKNCVVKMGETSKCTATDDDEYFVEVQGEPEQLP